MNRFIQLHFLTSYPPSNLNRDDLGRPKTALLGGVNRLRVSSQSLKRAWRTSDVFKTALSDHQGVRTKELGRRVYQQLLDGKVPDKIARTSAQSIAGVFGKLKTPKAEVLAKSPLMDLDIEQLAHVSPEEHAAIAALVQKIVQTKKEPTGSDLNLLRKENSAADIAMFGRMLASEPGYNIEAAVQVAHAITVHKVAVEDDFFTAVDDLNSGQEDMGAGHMGDTEFGAGLFYLYICINKELLLLNLGSSKELMGKTIASLIESAATVSPTGKQNSFASRARAMYGLAEKGIEQPRSLHAAFLQPVRGDDVLRQSIDNIKTLKANFDKVYGKCASGGEKSFNVTTGEGSMKEFIDFCKAD
jgi:CRISPR system Cascade subunit CasC